MKQERMMKTLAQPTGLKAIAEQAKVSVSLASKVLNNRLGSTRVHPETVRAIRQAASALGYRKNHAAAALVAGRQNVIGGFVHSIGVDGSGISEQIVRGMAAGAAERGRRLMLRFFETADAFLNHVSEISPSLLDGLVLAGIRHDELLGRLREIDEAGVPLITIHERRGGEKLEFPNVSVDQTQVGHLATQHLIDCGCRRIAHIMVWPSRAKGYQECLHNHGIADRRLVKAATNFSYASGAAAAAELVAQGVDFDGLFAQSDEQAVGAMNALIAAGKRVPQDVKIIGVDNSPMCRLAPVSLSSISNEFHQQGKRAVDLLVARIEGRKVESFTVEPTLHVRGSTSGHDDR
jgi:LacI family transcriptional regulator